MKGKKKMNKVVVACCGLAACACFADIEMLNIAHRGMWDAEVPQNTVEAIRRAYESGATWVETDFHYTKSGLIVCMHGQKELEEQTGCTKKIADLTAEDLATLNLGAKRNLANVYRIPLLDQVLALVPKHGVLQAEIKGYSPQYADVFDRAVKAHGLTEKNIVVSSFQYKALKDFKARYPKYRAVWLTGLGKKGKVPFLVQGYIAKCKAANIEVFCPGCDSTKGVMTPADADAVRAAGLEFRVFGVNSLADMKQAKALGAAGFTCNHWFKAYEWAREVGGVALLPARAPLPPRDANSIFSAKSPDGLNEILLTVSDTNLCYSVMRRGKTVVGDTWIGLTTREHGRMNCRRAGTAPKVTRRRIDGRVPTPIYKKSEVDLAANETKVDFGEWALVLHARNDGVAWRFETAFADEITVTAEDTNVRFPEGTELCYAQEGHFQTGWEKPAQIGPVESVKSGHPQIVMTPFTATVRGAGVVCVTESNLLDYPGLNFFRRSGEKDMLRSWQAGVPKDVEKGRRMTNVKSRHPYLAKTKGTRAFPWRVFVLADEPRGLVESDAVYALAEPARVKDVSWIKPGQVAWDWWNGFKITDVPGLDTGCNFETYKAYVDFAAANGIAYIIMDEGWSEHLDLDRPREAVNVPGVIAYAREKGVNVILWAAWAPLIDREARLRIFDRYAAMGAKGFKVDFMNRDDQSLERFLETTAADAAERKLVIMYHGIHKPTGLCRTFPNVLNYEGVYGLEQGHSIGGRKVVTANDVNLVFTRMIAGAMDYTPGAMRNRAFDAPEFKRGKDPNACYGTRCHQLALFPLFEAPVQMLCDSPTQYRTAPECTAFLTKVPTVWDATVGVAGEIGQYAAVARRKGKDWWLGAITNWDARSLSLPTDFLGGGEWNVEVFEDAPDANVNAEHYVRRTFKIRSGEPLKANLAPGGGFAARFSR